MTKINITMTFYPMYFVARSFDQIPVNNILIHLSRKSETFHFKPQLNIFKG